MKDIYNLKIKVARDFEVQGKLLHAAQVYISILNEYPDFTDAYFSLANLYELMGKIKPGIELLENFLDRNPKDYDVRFFLGQYLLRNSMWDEAVKILSFISPQENLMVSFFIGYSYFMLEEYELAEINFKNFISLNDKGDFLHEAYIYMAKIELYLERYESALDYAKKAEVLYSSFWELNLICAEIYYKTDMTAHALKEIEKAIKLKPQEPAVRKLAGYICLQAKEYLRAEKQFLKFIEYKEDVSFDIYIKLAEICLKVEKIKNALIYYDIALKIEPKNPLAIVGKKKASLILKNIVANDG